MKLVNFMNNIKSKKKDTFDEAISCSLEVLDDFNNKIGLLVPVGNWVLSDNELLLSFAEWRKKFMHFFFSQFTTSKDSTKNYLKNLSIDKEDRILFAIYSEDILFGHIGLSNVTSARAEIDNIIRGLPVKQKDLMYFSQKAMLNWAFNILKVDNVEAKVMSTNFAALSFHKKFGSKLKKRFFLKKVFQESSFSYEVCDRDSKTEKFFLNVIEIAKCDFFEIKKLKQNKLK